MADIINIIKFIALILGIPVLILNLFTGYYMYKKVKLEYEKERQEQKSANSKKNKHS